MTLELNKHRDDLLFVPIGGTDEIGLNFYLFHYKGKWLITDFGLGFADENYLGVDILLPDISFVKKHKKDIVGILITHAHEDHIGALPYLWDELECDIYASKFACEIISQKFKSVGINPVEKLKEISYEADLQLAPFKLSFCNLTHSVPEMMGVLIEAGNKKVFHTGDWRFDDKPIIGGAEDKKLEEIAKKGVDVMICDSTNIFNEKPTRSESELKDSLESLIKGYAENMVVVTTFASNISRIHSILSVAKKLKRKVVLLGTALWRMYEAGKKCGYFEGLPECLRDNHIATTKKAELLIIATGCQGESRASIARMAAGTHPKIKLATNDIVIFSSKIIPGNEKKIFGMLNQLCRKKIEVITENDHFVHVSGHPSKPELKRMYEIIKPKVAIPMHGEATHIHEHSKFAKSLGVKEVVEVGNGSVINLSSKKPEQIGALTLNPMVIDGISIIPSNGKVLKDRRTIANEGLVYAFVLVAKGKKIYDIKLSTPALLDEKLDQEIIDELLNTLIKNLEKLKNKSSKAVDNMARSIIKKFVKSELNKSPLIIVNVENI